MLDVALDDLQWGTTTGHRAVRRRPEVRPPQDALNLIKSRCLDPTRGDALQAVDELRQGHLRGIGHEQMHMVRLKVRLDEFALKVLAHRLPRGPQHREDPCADQTAAVLWYKDQVRVEVIDDVSSAAKIA